MIKIHQFLANCLNGAIAPSTPLLISKLANVSKEKKQMQDNSIRAVGRCFLKNAITTK